MHNRLTQIACITLSGLTLGLSGCSEPYMHRQDRIAASAGDAVEANKVLHIADPWPRGSFGHTAVSGRRVEPSIERYNSSTPGLGASRATAAAAPSPSVAQ